MYNWALCLSLAAGALYPAPTQAEAPESLLRKLYKADARWRDGCTLTYTVLKPLPMTNTNDTERLWYRGTLTGIGETWAAITTLEPDAAPPAYVPPDASGLLGNHNWRGEISVSRKTSVAALSSIDYCGSVYRFASVSVGPEGVTRDDTQSPPDDDRGKTMAYKAVNPIQNQHVHIPLLGSGRGFSIILWEITEISRVGDDGIIECVATGTAPGCTDPDAAFEWRLSIDSNSGYLVRRAECRSESNPDSVFIEIANEGTIDGEGGLLPETGHFSMLPGVLPESRSRYDLTFDQLRAPEDEAVFAEVRALLHQE